MSARPVLICLICLTGPGLPGCTRFPELDAVVSPAAARADYPELVPVERIMAATPEPRIAEDTADTIEARAAALRARAGRLRGAVIDDTARGRMQGDVPAI